MVARAIATADDQHGQPVDACVSPSQLLTLEVLRPPFESAQYTSYVFGRRCQEAGIAPSMGSTGDAYDKAAAESFFATLECELIDRSVFRNRTEARMGCSHFIEGFYNPRRRHSALGYRSPAEFERSYRETNVA